MLLAMVLATASLALGSAAPANAAYPTVSWPSAWSNPVQGGESFVLTTKWGAFSKGCNNYDSSNDAGYYLDAPSTSAHTGIDMNRDDGQTVVAIADGLVVENGLPWDKPGVSNKNVVVIEHTTSTGERFMAVYGHLHSDVVAKGAIQKGAYVGRVQTAGTGAHLHFGIKPGAWAGVTPNGSSASTVSGGNCTFNPVGSVDPLTYLSGRTPGGGGATSGRIPWIGAADSNLQLRLLHWTGAQWQNDNFGLGVAPSSSPSVQLDGTGKPFIAWVANGTNSLHLSHWTGTAWQHDNFSLGVASGTSPSLYLDSTGKPFIAWVANGTNSLHLSHWTGTAWQHDNFSLGVASGTSPSLYLDSTGKPFIAWVANGTNSLHLSHWTGTAWQHDNFSLGVASGTSPSLYLDSTGKPFIAWVANGTNSLHLSHWTGTAWQHDNFTLGVASGTSPSLYLDSTGKPFIAWVANGTNSLHLSHWTGTAWQHDNFDMAVLARTSPGASLGPDGEPFISWADHSATLRLSHWTGSAWQHDNFGMTVYAPPAPIVVNNQLPTISGTPRVGVKLAASAGTWSPSGSYAYQWLADGAAMSGLTGPTYTPAAWTKGKRISVRVTATKTGYTSGSATSTQTAVVAAGIITNSTAPSISGTGRVGYTLTANVGIWSPGALTYRYQWFRGTTAIGGATARTYKLPAAVQGQKIRVRVTAVRAGYTSLAMYSAYTAAIR